MALNVPSMQLSRPVTEPSRSRPRPATSPSVLTSNAMSKVTSPCTAEGLMSGHTVIDGGEQFGHGHRDAIGVAAVGRNGLGEAGCACETRAEPNKPAIRTVVMVMRGRMLK